MSCRNSRYQSKAITGRGSTTTARSQNPLTALPLPIHSGLLNLPQPELSQVQPSQSRRGSQTQAIRTSPNRNCAIGGSVTVVVWGLVISSVSRFMEGLLLVSSFIYTISL